jgi:hypothetical protein
MNFLYIFYLICIGIFTGVDNCKFVIGSQIVFIHFSILSIICETIKIVHLNSILIHVKIRCILKCSPFYLSMKPNVYELQV